MVYVIERFVLNKEIFGLISAVDGEQLFGLSFIEDLTEMRMPSEINPPFKLNKRRKLT